ncbi:MAG: MFS transporter [Methylocystaceae bacterium]|nr:MFS transporter [Methylocystaceae bacterium]
MNRLQRSLILLVTSILILGAVIVSIKAGLRFESSLTSQRLLEQKEIGRSTLDAIQKALNNGIPFERFKDADEYLGVIKADNPGLEYLIITKKGGEVIYASDLTGLKQFETLKGTLKEWESHSEPKKVESYFNMGLPITFKGEEIGFLHIGERANVIEQILRDIALDILTVLVVTILVATELLRPLLASTFVTPLQNLTNIFECVAKNDFRTYLPRDLVGGVSRLNHLINLKIHEVNQLAAQALKNKIPLPTHAAFDVTNKHNVLRVNTIENIRWPFFLLIFSEALSLSFLPHFIGQLDSTGIVLPRNVLISLPITLFMLLWTMTIPFVGFLCDRFGYRRTFCFGAAIAMLGLVSTALTTRLFDAIMWRALTAIGYGFVYLTTQIYISAYIPKSEATRGQAIFLSTFFAGSLSGAAIGGILVDRLGFEMTFLLSGILSGISGVYVFRFLSNEKEEGTKPKIVKLGEVIQLLRNKQFSAIIFLSAIPAKIALAGFLFYSIPTYLKSMGYNQSLIGRIMMAYGLAIILFGPQIARFADAAKDRLNFVAGGGILAAVSMSLPFFFDGLLGASLAVFGLGIAHSICVASQTTLINDRCRDSILEVGSATTISIFRLLERTGSVIGPVLLGAMIAFSDFQNAFFLIGSMALLIAALLMMLLVWYGQSIRRSHEAT